MGKTTKTKKMAKTIIADLESASIEKDKKSTQTILKFNSELKKFGFKKVYIKNQTITEDTLEDNLTLYFAPSFQYGLNYVYRDYMRDSFKEITNHLISLSGSGRFYKYYALKKYSFEEQVELKIKHNNKKYIVGNYLISRNIVVFYLPPNYADWKLGKDNEYFLEILSYIKYLVQEYKIKEKNINELKEQLFISKFTKAINFKIKDCSFKVNEATQCIEEYREKIAEWYSEATLGKLAIENLKQMSGQIKKSLLEKVEEIKQLKFIKDVSLTHEGIIINFEKIHIKVKDELIEMGEYKITLLPNTIQIINNEPVLYNGSTYHSPHIEKNNICFGNEKTLAYELLGKLELKKLVHFLYLYLKNYNPEDTYLSMNYWIAGKENNGAVPDDFSDEDNEEEEYEESED